MTVKRWKDSWWVFINHKGKRRAKRVGDRKAAELAATKIRARLALGEPVLTEDARRPALTFKEAAQRWLVAHFQSQQIRQATYDEYDRALRLHTYPRFGAKAVADVSRADVRDLVVDLMSQGKSRSLARNALAPIRQTFNQLIDDGVLATNPATRMGRYLKERTDRRARIDFLTPDEEHHLLETALTECPGHYCVFLSAVRTGLRIGELFGLQWADIDFNGRFIEVRRTLKDGGRVYPPKNGKIRRVDMSLQLADELRRFRAGHASRALKKGWGAIPWVFMDNRGHPLRQSNFGRRVFRDLLKKAKLRSLRFHDLRHTFASRLLQNGESLVYVKEQLGHSSIKITVDTYGHLIPGANKAAVDRLDATGRNPRATPGDDEKDAETGKPS